MNVKILVAVIAVLLSVVLYQCKQLKDCKTTKTNERCVNYRDSTINLINYTTATALFEKYIGYQKNRIGKLEDSTIDANSTWFSINTIKKYIYKIEDSLARMGMNPNIELGLRIYYGAYLDSNAMATTYPQLSSVPANYQHHHTVFMVPTFTDSVNKRYDFNPFLPLVNNRPVPLRLRLNGAKNGRENSVQNTESDYILNHGEVAPPPRVTIANLEFSLNNQ